MEGIQNSIDQECGIGTMFGGGIDAESAIWHRGGNNRARKQARVGWALTEVCKISMAHRHKVVVPTFDRISIQNSVRLSLDVRWFVDNDAVDSKVIAIGRIVSTKKSPLLLSPSSLPLFLSLSITNALSLHLIL